MKQLFFLITIVFLLSSCQEVTWENAQVKNRQLETTVAIQESVIDSCATLALYQDYIFLLDSNNLVQIKLIPANESTVKLSVGDVWLLMAIGFIFGILIILFLFNVALEH